MLYQFRITLIAALLLGIPVGALSQRLELRHSKTSVTSVHFMSDTKRLVSAGFDGTVVTWNRETGKQLWRKDIDQRSRAGDSYTISHILGMDLSADDGTIAISFSQARVVGEVLKPGNVYGISLLEAVNGDIRRTLQGHTDQIGRIAFSPDGTVLLSESADKTARLW